MSVISGGGKKIAVVGSGISGLSAAWLLSQGHEVTLYEAAPRLGGHTFTTDATVGGQTVAVDMGFIVYNEVTYPNLTAMFDHLGVATRATDMSFAVSLEGGAVEYGGLGLAPLLARPSNLLRPRFWSMLRDLFRFYREAPADRPFLDDATTLGEYLDTRGYGAAFRDDHLLPQAAAIWSAPVEAISEFPAAAFIRFFENHGLLKLVGRPVWRTVLGGSRSYIEKLVAPLGERVRTGVAVRNVRREGDHVWVSDSRGVSERFDAVVIATHAREALAMLHHPTLREQSLLGAFSYTSNQAVLHTDVRLMPRRQGVWSAWNYVGGLDGEGRRKLCVTYWMNLLQGLKSSRPLLVTLNPVTPPDPSQVICSETFQHPVFDQAALRAQRLLWTLQGQGGIWYCGAHFGAGFHEDGLQSGLAAAEALGGVRRPWTVAEESGRIFTGSNLTRAMAA
jgi:predicted NAD/FAD-binding protein